MSKTSIPNDYGQTDKTILVHFVVETQFVCEIEFFAINRYINQEIIKKKFIRSLSLAEPDRIKAGNRISIGVVIQNVYLYRHTHTQTHSYRYTNID